MGMRLNQTTWLVACAVVAGLVFAAESVLEPGPGGSLTIAMTLFLGLALGATVLMAGAEISDGHWHKPLLPQVAVLHNLLPAVLLLFLVNIPQLDMYPWVAHEGVWLNKNLFVIRHLVLIAAVFLVARKFVVEALRGGANARLWAVIFVFLFMIEMSMVGIEWFMTIEQPWFSTLFGAFIAVSGFLAGICTCALIIFGWRRRTDAPARLVQKSIGGLIFGFATFWAYFYFSQLIVIWYGNIPEETMYLAKRIGYHTPYWLPARLIFGMVWVTPFAVLLSRKNKTRPFVTSALAIVVMSGLTLMFWLMLVPVVPVSIPLLVLEIGLLAFLTMSLVKSHETLLRLPAPARGAVAAESH